MLAVSASVGTGRLQSAWEFVQMLCNTSAAHNYNSVLLKYLWETYVNISLLTAKV